MRDSKTAAIICKEFSIDFSEDVLSSFVQILFVNMLPLACTTHAVELATHFEAIISTKKIQY